MTIQATVVGNLGKDAELRQTNNGQSVLSFSVAASSGYGQNKKTEWVNCAVFGKRADSLSPYLTKGTRVTVFGAMSMNTYQTQAGETRSNMNLSVHDLVMMGGGSEPSQQPVQQTQAPQDDPLDDTSIPF